MVPDPSIMLFLSSKTCLNLYQSSPFINLINGRTCIFPGFLTSSTAQTQCPCLSLSCCHDTFLEPTPCLSLLPYTLLFTVTETYRKWKSRSSLYSKSEDEGAQIFFDFIQKIITLAFDESKVVILSSHSNNDLGKY
ncbi:hypothetical protein C5167_043768 [Papaver somniferum]|uniref:Uncharacterized protein n=1 Tax=Papaver somniferum TaxID=3469 RepID=A0A4Y7LAI5_PAPSO|nr:hypothetical protein C5167_043768 [Papaver somniferum]